MSDEMVSFGKYKGKSVEALLDDRPYLDWLLSQSWFKEKFGNVYNVVINNGNEPSETPEHNAMQIKFLSQEYRQKFACEIFWELMPCTDAPEFEKDGIDVCFSPNPYRMTTICVEIKPTVGDDYPAILRQVKRYKKNNPLATFVLLVREYTGSGASESEFTHFFLSQGVEVVFESEVEGIDMSEYQK